MAVTAYLPLVVSRIESSSVAGMFSAKTACHNPLIQSSLYLSILLSYWSQPVRPQPVEKCLIEPQEIWNDPQVELSCSRRNPALHSTYKRSITLQ
jgi:hypothetical protein